MTKWRVGCPIIIFNDPDDAKYLYVAYRDLSKKIIWATVIIKFD